MDKVIDAAAYADFLMASEMGGEVWKGYSRGWWSPMLDKARRLASRAGGC